MAISNASNQIVKVNLIPGIIPSVLHLSQYDTGAGRPITFSVYDGSQAFTIPSGVSIAFEGTKPDGNGFSFTCSKSGSNALLTNYTNQMTALPGKIMCQLVFTDTSGGRVGSLPVLMVVTPAGINGDTVISDSDIEAIIAAQNAYAVLNARLDAAIDQMNTTTNKAIDQMNTKANDLQNQYAVTNAKLDTAISAATQDSEVQDIRVKADGTTAATAGNAVREQFTELKNDLSDISRTGTNLFDKDNVNALNAYIYGPQRATGTLTANANAKTVYVPCEANTEYTVSKQSATARFSIACTSELPAVGVAVDNIATYSANTAITITTNDSAKYLVAFIYLSTVDTNVTFEQICDGLQIQTGSAATAYEPYKMTAIDDVARSRISVIEGNGALNGIFKNVQVTAIPQAASLGSALSFNISTMTGSGNATFENGAWRISGGGSISGSISGIVANKTYLIELNISNVWGVNGDINTNLATITLGDKSLSIFSAADANWNIALAPTTSGTVTLSCTFHENWNGVINGITVRPVNALASTPLKINNIPIRTNYANASFGGHEKLLLSTNCGRLNTSLGINAQRDINTGMWNTAFGYNSQLKLTQGKGNNAFGCFAQNVLETGCYNNAFGESAQNHLTDGQWNDGFGIEAQGMATSAKNNVAFGRRSQHLLQTGNFNTAIGAWSGFNSHDVSGEGTNAVKTSSFTTLVGGASTLNRPDTGDSDYATALGFQTKVGKQGVAIGALAEAGNGGIAIGFGAVAGVNEVVIGNKKIIFNSDHTVTWEDVT